MPYSIPLERVKSWLACILPICLLQSEYMGKKSQKKRIHLKLADQTVLPLDPLPFPVMVTIAALFFLLLTYLFLILPSHNNPFDKAYATKSPFTQ